MSLQAAIDAQFAAAEASGARPFRLELQPAEIEALRDAGVLEPKPSPHDSCSGVRQAVKVYPATGRSELFAQPADQLLALHLPIG